MPDQCRRYEAADLMVDGERTWVRNQAATPLFTTLHGFVQNHTDSASVVTCSIGTVVQRLVFDA